MRWRSLSLIWIGYYNQSATSFSITHLHHSSCLQLPCQSLQSSTLQKLRFSQCKKCHRCYQVINTSFNAKSEGKKVEKATIDHDTIHLDYLITDSLHLQDEQRPSLLKALSNPRDILASIVMIIGMMISIFNMVGKYDNSYQLLELSAVTLGIISAIAHLIQINSGYMISLNFRRGIVDDAAVNLYAALYSGAVSWLALRTSQFCPNILTWKICDVLFSVSSIIIFVYSLAAPLVTLLGRRDDGGGNFAYRASQFIVSSVREQHYFINGTSNKLRYNNILLPALSETELLRAQGLLFIGILGCVFTPDALSFCLGGQEWWNRISNIHHSQQTLESSTSLFALFATESSMIAHRIGKQGVADFRTIVPVFVGVCFILAVIPCVCALYWLGDGVSFFSFYRE